MGKFNSISSINDFGKELSIELKSIGFMELSEEILKINSIFHTTSSEYLGMFRDSLYKVKEQAANRLSRKSIHNVNRAIISIDNAFNK